MINLIFNIIFQKHENDIAFWRQLWSRKIELFNKTGMTDWDSFSSQRYYQILLSDLTTYLDFDSKNKKVLEMGAGTGILSLLMAAKGAEVYLVDILPEAIVYMKILENKLKKELPFFLGSVKYITKDFNSLTNKDFPYHYFDLVHNMGVIEEYSSDEVVIILSKMRKYTHSKGITLVGVPNFFNPYLIKIWSKYGKGNEIFYTKRLLRKVLLKAGLVNVKVINSSYVYPFKRFTKLERWLGRHGLGFLKIAIIRF